MSKEQPQFSRRTFLKIIAASMVGLTAGTFSPDLRSPVVHLWETAWGAEGGYRWFPETKFSVQQEFLREFKRLGGLKHLGYPISRPFSSDIFTYQAFQERILQLSPEESQPVVANIMDWFHETDKDEWLLSKGIPRHFPENDGSDGNWEKAKEARLGWLTQPEIAQAYFQNSDPLGFFGLPTSKPEKHGPFITQRFQKGVLQFWVEEVLGMPKKGKVVGVLVGELAREAGFIPPEALITENFQREKVVLPPVIYRGDPESPSIALTIDDAWDTGWVREALAIARLNQTRMTLFPVGSMILDQAELWRQAFNEGHEIGSHTFNHSWLTSLSNEGIVWQIQASQNALDQALGFHYPMRLLRPPGGDGGYNGGNSRVVSVAQSLGYSLAMWSVDSGGATTFWGLDSKPIINHVLNLAKSGDIVLFHFNSNDIGALPTIIESLKARNLQSVTLSELFA